MPSASDAAPRPGSTSGPDPDASRRIGAPPDPPVRLARVAYLGFDACDAGIVRELVAQGELPAFARVLADGASVSTFAPTGVFPSAIWATFATAVSKIDDVDESTDMSLALLVLTEARFCCCSCCCCCCCCCFWSC